MTVHYCM